jgi:acetyl esterase/lipase
LLQASDVAHALAFVQQHASEWGGDPARVVLMGHSAGAHLVALLTAAPSLAVAAGAAPWIGTVSLDSGTLDVPATMGRPHRELFDAAFGNDPVVWQRLSPIHRLAGPTVPMLVVCSSQRQEPCIQGEQFAAAARKAGSRVTVLPVDKSHAEVNADLGISSAYTDAVIAFLDYDIGYSAILKAKALCFVLKICSCFKPYVVHFVPPFRHIFWLTSCGL